jgi:hypothetical protein
MINPVRIIVFSLIAYLNIKILIGYCILNVGYLIYES